MSMIFDHICKAVGANPAYAQGGGGNASFKKDGKLYIKASGFRLSEFSENSACVVLDLEKVKMAFEHMLGAHADETAYVRASQEAVIESRGGSNLRPSIETGFHVFLDTYILHTHSVFVNAFTCVEYGKERLEEIFGSRLQWVWVPYVNPGSSLTREVKKIRENYIHEMNTVPHVFFLQNHGLIVDGETPEEVGKMHEKVTELIQEKLIGKKEYPIPQITRVSENTYQSATLFLREFIRAYPEKVTQFKKLVLFPDQAVYGMSMAFDNTEGNKISISLETGSVVYHANEKEALVMEEILVAWSWIIDSIVTRGEACSVISPENCAYILGMDSEKYRQALLK